MTWEPVIGGGSSTPPGFDKLENSGITALGGFKDLLFAGTGSLYCKDGVELWRSRDAGATWEPVAGERVALMTELARESKYVLDLEVFEGALYLSTGDQRTGGSEIWRTLDGSSWQAVVGAPSPYCAGMGNPNHDMIYDLETFNGHLYAAVLSFVRQGGALWRTPDGATWEVIVGDGSSVYPAGFGEPGNFRLVTLDASADTLYIGSVNERGAQLWASSDGRRWQRIVGPDTESSGGFGNTANRAINALRVFQSHLYAGTHNPDDAGELWRWERPQPKAMRSPL